jgi:hypothetical protein
MFALQNDMDTYDNFVNDSAYIPTRTSSNVLNATSSHSSSTTNQVVSSLKQNSSKAPKQLGKYGAIKVPSVDRFDLLQCFPRAHKYAEFDIEQQSDALLQATEFHLLSTELTNTLLKLACLSSNYRRIWCKTIVQSGGQITYKFMYAIRHTSNGQYECVVREKDSDGVQLEISRSETNTCILTRLGMDEEYQPEMLLILINYIIEVHNTKINDTDKLVFIFRFNCPKSCTYVEYLKNKGYIWSVAGLYPCFYLYKS